MSHSHDGGLGLRGMTIASLAYLVATVVLTYPLALNPASLGRLDNADARLNAWAMSWVAHQFPKDPLHLFQANIFYPLPNTLAFSEHLFIPGLIGWPILRLSNDLVLTFNLVLLISIFFSALGMYVLVHTLTLNRTAALLSGLFFSFASYRFARLPHIQMQLYGFLPLALACIHRFFAGGKGRWAFAFAFFFILQALSGTYLAAMTAVASVVAFVVLGVFQRPSRKQLFSITLAVVLIASALYPFVRPYLWVNRTLGVEWDLEGIGSLSATPWSYLASASRLYRGLVGDFIPQREITDYLFPGLTLIVLGSAGIWLSRRGDFKRSRGAVACYLGILVVGAWMSLGPRAPLYDVLYENIVFFRGLRALSRFGLLPLLSLSVFSGYTVGWLHQRIHSRLYRNIVAVALALLFIGESTVVPLELTPFEDRPPEVYTWLHDEAKSGPIVELPYKRIDTRYMFWARHHGFRPMLNGDSGFIPPPHVWMREIFLRFPSPDSLELLRRMDVSYVVLHLGPYRRNNPGLIRLIDDLKLYEDRLPTIATFGRDLVLEVTNESRASPDTRLRPGMGRALRLQRADGPLFDSSLDTIWRGESNIERLVIPLEGYETIEGVRLHYGRAPRIPVTKMKVEILESGGQWSERWASPDDWPALTEMVVSLLENSNDGTQTLTFQPIRTDSLRIELHGYDREPPEIAELELLTR